MSKRDRTPLHDIHGSATAHVTTTPWDAEGVATIEASGSDVRSALEAGLRAVLSISTAGSPALAASDRSVPLQGEGEDLAELFLDLIEDFLDVMALSAFACHDVTIDGVLHRDGGGYVAWGYATESTAPAPRTDLPSWHKMPTVESTMDGIVFRATLTRTDE
jgi:hypothetical protein